MKNLMPVGALLCFLINVSHLPAAEKWEGTDSFDNSQRWSPFVDPVSGGRIVNSDGRLVYECSKEGQEWTSAAWIWGNSKQGVAVPTGRSWESGCEVTFPESSPIPDLSEAGFIMGAVRFSKGSSRAVYWGINGSYDPSRQFHDTLQAYSDYNFEQRPGRFDGGPADQTNTVSIGSRVFYLSFRHNALAGTDLFEVRDNPSGPALYQRTGNSDLSRSLWVNLFLAMGIDHYKSWPLGGNNLSIDNWYLRSFQPDPINLNPKNDTSNGVAYSVAVTSLSMTGASLNGTVALTVGTASASLPITGSIDKNGYLALVASGKKANGTSGFSCKLLFDVVTGTYRPGKNSVTAPMQKAIKF